MGDFWTTLGTMLAGVAACIALLYNAYVQRYGKKPYLVMSLDIDKKNAALLIANTGTAPARIKSVKANDKWNNLNNLLDINILMYLKDLTIYPGQELRFELMRDIIKLRLWDFYQDKNNYSSPYLLTATLSYENLSPTIRDSLSSQEIHINVTCAFLTAGQILEIVPQERLSALVEAFATSMGLSSESPYDASEDK